MYYYYYTKLYYSNIFYNGIVLSKLYYCSGGINMFNIKDDVLKGLVYIYMSLYKYSICHKIHSKYYLCKNYLEEGT